MIREDYLYVCCQLFYYDFKYSSYPVRIINKTTTMKIRRILFCMATIAISQISMAQKVQTAAQVPTCGQKSGIGCPINRNSCHGDTRRHLNCGKKGIHAAQLCRPNRNSDNRQRCISRNRTGQM